MAKRTVTPKAVKVAKYFALQLQEDCIDVERIVVFGSQAGGSPAKDSDVDLIVVSKNFRKKDLFKRAEMIGRAYSATVEKFLVPMDIIMETPEEYNPDFGVVVFAA